MTESMHLLVEESWLLFFDVQGMRERELRGAVTAVLLRHGA